MLVDVGDATSGLVYLLGSVEEEADGVRTGSTPDALMGSLLDRSVGSHDGAAVGRAVGLLDGCDDGSPLG